MRWTSRRVLIPALVITAVWLGNLSALVKLFAARPTLLARRGVHQDYSHEGLRDGNHGNVHHLHRSPPIVKCGERPGSTQRPSQLV